MSFDRSPEYVAENKRLAAKALREMGIEPEAEEAGWAFTLAGGYEWTAEDDAEWKKPLQTAGAFLIDSDAVIRWVKTGQRVVDFSRISNDWVHRLHEERTHESPRASARCRWDEYRSRYTRVRLDTLTRGGT